MVLPYQRMWPDGICRVTNTRYTKTIQYQDINYQLSQNEDKTAIFEAWCDFLNYFDSSVQFQLSFVNLSASQETFARSISIPPCGDEFDGIRAEYAGMLQNQLARGNNGLIKTKYLTFGVEADNLRAAKPRLERIETDLLNNFKRLGVVAAPLNGFERLHVMHDILRMDEQEPFRFSWDWLAPSGLSTKDFIAPSSFEFKTGRQFRMGKKLGAVSFVQILAPELNDRMLADFLDMESSVLVNLHVQSVDQVNAIKTVKRKITDLDKSKIEEQKKAVRAGYDMDIIPSDLATYGAEAKKLLQDLQSRNERMFLLTFLILNTADTPRQLDNNIFQTSSIAQKYNCALTRLDFQQEEGLMSSLPLGLNQIEIQRGLTTSSVAIFVPFTTQELFQNGSEALYYGINALSNNLIMVDRKLLKNPNGLILGTPGSGKSFSAKREITNAFLICPKDDIIICDPEGEYTPLVERLHGQVIKLSPTGKGYDGSPCYINPMDLNLDYSDDDNPLSLKSDFILSLCELIVGGKDGLAPVEKTIIDRCVRIVYRDYLNDPKPENMPLLEDLYNALRAQDEKEAQYIATALEIYVTGSLNVFNHHTNVDVNSRIVCYDIKELGKQLKKIGMLVVQDQVWNRVTINRAAHKTTRYYQVKYDAKGNVISVDTASNALSAVKKEYITSFGDIETAVNDNDTVLLEMVETKTVHNALDKKLTLKGSTLYDATSAKLGVAVDDDTNIVFIQKNDNKETTSFETGVKALETALKNLNEVSKDTYSYEFSAYIEDGIATTVVIRDLTAGEYEGSKPATKADYTFDGLTAYVNDNGAIKFSEATCAAISGWELGTPATVEYTISVNGSAARTYKQTLTSSVAMSGLAGTMTVPGLTVKNGSNLEINVVVTFKGTGTDTNTYTVSGTCYIA